METQQLREDIIRNFSSIKNAFHNKHCVLPEGLTRSQWQVLLWVDQQTTVSTGDIARAFHISASAATQLVNSLEQGHLTSKKQSTVDRRKWNISLTKKGQTKVSAMHIERKKQAQRLLSSLSDQELHTLHAIQIKMLHNLEL